MVFISGLRSVLEMALDTVLNYKVPSVAQDGSFVTFGHWFRDECSVYSPIRAWPKIPMLSKNFLEVGF